MKYLIRSNENTLVTYSSIWKEIDWNRVTLLAESTIDVCILVMAGTLSIQPWSFQQRQYSRLFKYYFLFSSVHLAFNLSVCSSVFVYSSFKLLRQCIFYFLKIETWIFSKWRILTVSVEHKYYFKYFHAEILWGQGNYPLLFSSKKLGYMPSGMWIADVSWWCHQGFSTAVVNCIYKAPVCLSTTVNVFGI